MMNFQSLHRRIGLYRHGVALIMAACLGIKDSRGAAGAGRAANVVNKMSFF